MTDASSGWNESDGALRRTVTDNDRNLAAAIDKLLA
jgi:hypothetical protein